VKEGRKADAIGLLDGLLADARKQLPKDSPQMAVAMAEYGGAMLAVGEFVKAEPVLREGLLIREKVEPNAWTTFYARTRLGESLLGQRKYAGAEPLLLSGYEGMKPREENIPAGSRQVLTESLDRLIELYTATNKPDQAQKWRTERAKYLIIAPPPPPK
jgi:hypothetical protein